MNPALAIGLVFFIGGFVCGVFTPHALVYARVCGRFIRIMHRKNKKIRELVIERHKLRRFIILNTLKNSKK